MTSTTQNGQTSVQLPRAKNVRKRSRLARAADRRIEGSFVLLPTRLLRHPQIHALSVHAKSLLLTLLAQIRIGKEGPKNNGDLAITYSMMHRDYGFRSPSTLHKAKQELLDKHVIVETRKGGRHKCSLYALTCFSIDECDGKLDCLPTKLSPCTWGGDKIEPRIEIPATRNVSMPRNPRYRGTLLDQIVLSPNQSRQLH